MRTLLLAGFLLAGLASQAAAQLAVGPVAINNTVNGVPVTVSATSYTTVKPVDNDIVVTARIFADLVDLQKKIASIVGKFKPGDTCANKGAETNPVRWLKSSARGPRGG